MSSSSSAHRPDPHADKATPAPGLEQNLVRTPHPLIVRLVEFRQAKGWTQEQLAHRLSIPLNTLRGYECGNRNPGGTNTVKILNLIGMPKRAAARKPPVEQKEPQ